MSTAIEVILVTALVLGIVAAMLGVIYVWEKYVRGTRVEHLVDRFFDRLGDMFFR